MRVNGSETHIERAEISRSKGGFDTLSPFNYIMDNFTDSNFFYHWPMVDSVKEVLKSFEKFFFQFLFFVQLYNFGNFGQGLGNF